MYIQYTNILIQFDIIQQETEQIKQKYNNRQQEEELIIRIAFNLVVLNVLR